MPDEDYAETPTDEKEEASEEKSEQQSHMPDASFLDGFPSIPHLPFSPQVHSGALLPTTLVGSCPFDASLMKHTYGCCYRRYQAAV